MKGSDEKCRWYPACPMKRYYEEGLLEKHYINTYCYDRWESCARYRLEMAGKPHPNWLRQDGVLDERLKPARPPRTGSR